VSGAPLRYRSANFLHIGGAVLDGLRQHVGVADETDDAIVEFHAIEQRPQVAFPERNRAIRDVLRDELTESREHLVGKVFLTGSRCLKPFELGVDLGDLLPAQGDAARARSAWGEDSCLGPGHKTSDDPPGVAYLYAPDRKASQPIRRLQGFVGVLQVDGYAGYKALAERNAVRLAFCWSLVRRRFYELAEAGPAPIASEALVRIAELYRIEGDIRGRSAGERRAARQARSRPVLEALEPWLRAKLRIVRCTA
jgi:Transposase IS66 family